MRIRFLFPVFSWQETVSFFKGSGKIIDIRKAAGQSNFAHGFIRMVEHGGSGLQTNGSQILFGRKPCQFLKSMGQIAGTDAKFLAQISDFDVLAEMTV